MRLNTVMSYTKYLKIISRARVGYKMVASQQGAKRRVGYNDLISNKREWNNCFIKNAQKNCNILAPQLFLLTLIGYDIYATGISTSRLSSTFQEIVLDLRSA